MDGQKRVISAVSDAVRPKRSVFFALCDDDGAEPPCLPGFSSAHGTHAFAIGVPSWADMSAWAWILLFCSSEQNHFLENSVRFFTRFIGAKEQGYMRADVKESSGLRLQDPVERISGIGRKVATLLKNRMNVQTVEDLLCVVPVRWIDRRVFTPIQEVVHALTLLQKNRTRISPDPSRNSLTPVQEVVQVVGTVRSVRVFTIGKRKSRTILEIVVEDGSGARLSLFWLHGIGWYQRRWKRGMRVVVIGKPVIFFDRPAMIHPQVEDADRILNQPERLRLQPVYPLPASTSRTLSQTKFIQWIQSALQGLRPASIPDWLPDEIRRKYGFPPRHVAFGWLHLPQDMAQFEQALNRMKYEEVFLMQLVLVRERITRRTLQQGIRLETPGNLVREFVSQRLPFQLTSDQKRAIREIWQDFHSGHPMRRLLQGDVGSGKTLVALMSTLMMVDHGYQVCLMAPTEVLARQHARNFQKYLKGLKRKDGRTIQVQVLTASVRGNTRKELLRLLRTGHIHILVGTHALIEDPVEFHQLGLVIIDEQHRFGVVQRGKLLFKGQKGRQIPHLLVMSATPIPRTLALTIYGDLDISVIREMPPGRKPVRTFHVFADRRMEVYWWVRERLRQGEKAYIVFPLIEESEHSDYENLMEGVQRIRQFFGPEFPCVILHGRMKPEEKNEAMTQFTDGDARILVATNVIEVGIDVPEATIIVIESAERFGLAQLHQLRGRVCRSTRQPHCFLITRPNLSPEAYQRIQAMLQTTSGFEIAELDLEMRGPGDLLGLEQSGRDLFRFVRLPRDQEWLLRARKDAEELLRRDVHLRQYPQLLRVLLQNRERILWQKVG